MKWTVAIVAVVVGVTGLFRAADAQPRRYFDDGGRCFARHGTVSPEQRLESCTALIHSAGQTRRAVVAAYNRGGIAYDDKGEHDRAIADFDEAIRLDPKSAFAYNNRGGAYASKGDYARAIADYDQALTLDPSLAATRQKPRARPDRHCSAGRARRTGA
jgi:tetratricopeptide (TPR) repeat protein